MISILIPVKDYDCHLLVEELHIQGEALGTPYEIIVGEDGTSPDNLELNRIAETLPNCKRIIQERNIGRAAIRNILASNAQYDNLIFIDCDAVVEKSDFLSNYLVALKHHDVVCGGLYHADTMPDSECSLRFKYEKNADKLRSAAVRNKAPYDKFTTFNFAIRKELFDTIRFNSEMTRYGHEDTLFGKELKKRNARIVHIDNQLLHSGLEDNRTYLRKVEQSIETLFEFKEVIGTTPLLKAASRLEQLHLAGIFRIFWKTVQKPMRKNLTGKNPSLKILVLYKLGYYCNLCK